MPPIARILCPIDFSEASSHAIDHAVALARWNHASITAFHVYNPMFPAEHLHADILGCFEGARSDGIVVEVIVESGQPVRHILGRAVAMPADLIVMGTHGTSGFEHLVLGSVTEKVLRKAPCPVLTVPPRAQATSRLPFRRILCAVDFSDWSLTAMALAFSLAQGSNAVTTLLHVIEWPWEEPPPPTWSELPPEQATALKEYRRYLEERATARLDALLRDAGRDGQAARSRVVHGKSYVEILRAAAEDDTDLVVMGVHGRNAFDMMLFGSTTNHVVRSATCPVLTLRQ